MKKYNQMEIVYVLSVTPYAYNVPPKITVNHVCKLLIFIKVTPATRLA